MSLTDQQAILAARYPGSIHFDGFFAPMRAEADVFELEVEGTIPADLDGAFYRIGADNQFPPAREDDIYINGDGMVTMIRFRDGHADLRSRYVRTRRWQLERAARRALFSAYRNPFFYDPSVADETDDGNANTALVWHGGRLLALKEGARPYELDPVTLETRGVWDFHGELESHTFTAHPKVDPVTGQMLAFAYNSSGRPDADIVLFEVDPSGHISRTQRFDAPYSSMIHDWLVTRDHIVIHFSPMISDYERMKTEPQYFIWDAALPAHVAIIPRAQGVEGIRWFSSDLVMQTHSLNAWSEGDTVFVDHFVTPVGWLGQFSKTTEAPITNGPPMLERWTFDMREGAPKPVIDGPKAQRERLYHNPCDFPTEDQRFMMSKLRHHWIGCFDPTLGPPPGGRTPMGGPPFNCLVHLDEDIGQPSVFFPGPNSSPEEPMFVLKHPDADEGEGYLISVIKRYDLNRSDIVILDALDIEAGPIATLKVPFRLRHAFHCAWISGADLDRSART
jgi:carotenoid cleavage dioxygenase-like enzyme